MEEEFQSVDKLDEVCALLDELAVKYEDHYNDDNEFSYLADGEVSIKIPDSFIERTMFIDFQGEISLYFADWHAHYCLDETYYAEFRETLTAILKNDLCSAAYFYGEELKWGGSTLALRADVENKPPDEAFAGNRIMAQVYREKWENDGAEVRFLFWNPKYDKIIAIEKR